MSNVIERAIRVLNMWSDNGTRRQAQALSDAGLLAQGWRDIKDAPRGGRWVQVWWPSITDAPFAAYEVDGVWHAAPSGDAWPGEGPTHFMPLPAPPQEPKP